MRLYGLAFQTVDAGGWQARQAVERDADYTFVKKVKARALLLGSP